MDHQDSGEAISILYIGLSSDINFCLESFCFNKPTVEASG